MVNTRLPFSPLCPHTYTQVRALPNLTETLGSFRSYASGGHPEAIFLHCAHYAPCWQTPALRSLTMKTRTGGWGGGQAHRHARSVVCSGNKVVLSIMLICDDVLSVQNRYTISPHSMCEKRHS